MKLFVCVTYLSIIEKIPNLSISTIFRVASILFVDLLNASDIVFSGTLRNIFGSLLKFPDDPYQFGIF